MSLICFDNHILIWGIKEQATKGQEDMIPMAKNFIDSLKDETSVLIPSIVIAEYLMPIPQELHAMVINLFNKNFIIAPFDALAASKFALIWKTNKPTDEADGIIKNDITKAELKADSMIVAIAVARKAECIYSHDKWIKTFAKGFIDVKDIPFLPKQVNAFDLIPESTNWGNIPPKLNQPN